MTSRAARLIRDLHRGLDDAGIGANLLGGIAGDALTYQRAPLGTIDSTVTLGAVRTGYPGIAKMTIRPTSLADAGLGRVRWIMSGGRQVRLPSVLDAGHRRCRPGWIEIYKLACSFRRVVRAVETTSG